MGPRRKPWQDLVGGWYQRNRTWPSSGNPALLYLQKDQAFPQLQRSLMEQHSHCGTKAMTQSRWGPEPDTQIAHKPKLHPHHPGVHKLSLGTGEEAEPRKLNKTQRGWVSRDKAARWAWPSSRCQLSPAAEWGEATSRPSSAGFRIRGFVSVSPTTPCTGPGPREHSRDACGVEQL